MGHATGLVVLLFTAGGAALWQVRSEGRKEGSGGEGDSYTIPPHHCVVFASCVQDMHSSSVSLSSVVLRCLAYSDVL